MKTVYIKHEKKDSKEKILCEFTLNSTPKYSVQCAEYDRYTGRLIESKIISCQSLEQALEEYPKAYSYLTKSARLEKARAIRKRIKAKINRYEYDHQDEIAAPRCMMKARRKINNWINRNEPQERIVKRDFWDCML